MKIDNLLYGVLLFLIVCLCIGIYGRKLDKEVSYDSFIEPILEETIEDPITQLSYDLLKNTNEDIIGILTIPNLIDEPIVQGKDNSEYLRRNIYYDEVSAGTCFMDNENTLDNMNLVIYGHSSKYRNILLTPLMGYKAQVFAQNNNIIYFNRHPYELFSVFIYPATNSVKPFFIEKNFEEGIQKNIKELKKRSMYQLDIKEEEVDQLLTLITCNISDDNERLVLVAGHIKNSG